MERQVAEALQEAGVAFQHEMDGGTEGLDFYLPDYDVYLEVKRFHSDRIAYQMKRGGNVIALQGAAAVRMFVQLLNDRIPSTGD